MENHPVPQNISSYQFRLVGDMTLKQFLELAGGVGVALLFYASGLPAFIKWPLIALSVLLGAAFAFLPISGRPFEVWVAAFFRSIYTPTLFYWKKNEKVFFTPEKSDVPKQTLAPTTATHKEKSPLNEFLGNLEDAEKSFLDRVGDLFNAPEPAQNVSSTVAQTPALNMQATIPQPQAAPVPQTLMPATLVAPVVPSPQAPAHPSPPQRPSVQIPHAKPVEVQKGTPAQKNPQTPSSIDQIVSQPVKSPLTEKAKASAKQANESTDTGAPAMPEQANIIVGQVLDQNGKIIEGAILEITDSAGRPVRALKTNKAGHFRIVTPLLNGFYNIETERDGFKFDPVKFETSGSIIKPLKISASGTAPIEDQK